MRPENRGFDSFFGYLQGAEDHYTRMQFQAKDWYGVDFSADGKPSNATWGHYGTDLYSQRAREILDNAESGKPFFLYYSMQNVHYPLQAPEHFKIKYDWIEDEKRRNYAAMVTTMDQGFGDLIQMLKLNGHWENTLVIVTADNGGETRYGGNNYPLRSQKWSLYEGGVRANSFISGGFLKTQSKNNIPNKYHGLFHVSDWFTTILSAVDCNSSDENSHSPKR